MFRNELAKKMAGQMVTTVVLELLEVTTWLLPQHVTPDKIK